MKPKSQNYFTESSEDIPRKGHGSWNFSPKVSCEKLPVPHKPHPVRSKIWLPSLRLWPAHFPSSGLVPSHPISTALEELELLPCFWKYAHSPEKSTQR